MKLTVAILTHNEEGMIESCILSVKWADEILVVDAQSSDRTVEIAENLGASVVEISWRGFAHQRNEAVRLAKNPWILFVDADERVSKALSYEIKDFLGGNGDFVAGAIPRVNFLLGKKQIHGGWWPDFQIRLLKKEAFSKWQGELHERPIFVGKLKHFKSPLYHLTHKKILKMLEKTIEYADIEARLLFESNAPRVTTLTFFRKIAGEFYRRGIRNKGFLDGIEGWIEVLYQSFSVFITYVQLWEYQKKISTDEQYRIIDQELLKE